MTTKREDSSIAKAAATGVADEATSTSSEAEKHMISPRERWLLVHENAYARAQKRGFTGGDAYEDWLQAEQEIDSKYATDFRGVFAHTDAEEMSEQFKGVVAGYGFGHLGLDALLEKHRDGLENLAAYNRDLINSTSELATQQTALFQDAVSAAVKTLQSFAHGRLSTDGIAKQAELSTQVIENALSHFKALTESVAEISPRAKKTDDDE